MGNRTQHFRRAATLVIYWRDAHFILENYFTGNRVQAMARTAAILDFFGEWRTLKDFYLQFSDYDRASLTRSVRELVKRHLLLRRGSLEDRRDSRVLESWSSWLPAAGILQFATRHARYDGNLELAWRNFQQRAQRTPLPPAVKRYPNAPQISLPISEKSSELTEVLTARRTWRRFSRHPIALADLATMLRLTYGVQRWVNFPGIGRLALKTAPSAGARHPIEAYVLAVRVAGLTGGLYHYEAASHRLELIKSGASPQKLVKFVANQWWYSGAAALVLMTAVFSRNRWKYEDPAAYRAVMLDAGHLCQNFCLLATWLKLAPFCTMAFDQNLIEKELSLDGIEESVVYAVGVGVRPAGVAWAPWPSPRKWTAMTTETG